jgi:hypothetical protein
MRTFCSVLGRIPLQAFGVDRRLVWNVVREQNLHPFHRQKVQAPLGPSDFLRRDKFIGLFTKIQKIPTFPRWCCSRIVHASPEREFSTATTAMFGQKQTLMLHLFTGTNKALCSTFGRALLMTFWLGLTCYPDSSVHRFTVCFWRKGTVGPFYPDSSVHRFTLCCWRKGTVGPCYPDSSVHRFTACFWRKGTGNAGGNLVVHLDKHVVPVRQGCSSFCAPGSRTSHRHLQRGGPVA